MSLSDSLIKSLADVYTFSLRLKYYHWNIEGKDFLSYHNLFDEIYKDVYQSIDTLAELIRTLDVYVPASLENFKNITDIKEEHINPSSISMCLSALENNSIVTLSLLNSYEESEKAGEIGISSFLQERIQNHEKHKWFLNSILKEVVN